MQASERLHQAKADQGFTVLGVLVENAAADPPTQDDLRAWTKAYAVTFPVLGDATKSAFSAYVPSPVLPSSFLVGRDGIVRYTAQGTIDEAATEAKLEAAIDEALAAPVAPATPAPTGP